MHSSTTPVHKRIGRTPKTPRTTTAMTTDVLDAAIEVQRFFRKKRWRFCIIGALAAIRWGVIRTTHDVDVNLLVKFGKEREIIAGLLEALPPRIDDALEFALRNRVVLCHAKNGIEVDISVAASGYEEKIVERATPYQFAPRRSLITTSAEDTIVLKAIADREQDWVDIQGILVRQYGKLDWDYINRELAQLCELKDDSGPLHQLDERRRKTQDRRPKNK